MILLIIFPLTFGSDLLYNTCMAQEYDTTGKDILNEQIGELMQESSFFQHQREKFVAEGITQGAKEATLKNLLTVLNAKFHTEAVRALTPALENVDDLQRLEQLHLAAVNAKTLDTFTEALFE